MTKEFCVDDFNKDVLIVLNEVFSSYGINPIREECVGFVLHCEVDMLPRLEERRSLLGVYPKLNRDKARI